MDFDQKRPDESQDNTLDQLPETYAQSLEDGVLGVRVKATGYEPLRMSK
jgi:hypothetical protein